MRLTPWREKQFDQLKELFDFEKSILNSGYLGEASNLKGSWPVALDVSEDKDNIIVKADLPGFKKEDISVTLDNNILAIRGERKSEVEKKEKNFHRVERSYGVFERSLDIGIAIDQTKILANYKDGVLEIILPKTDQVKPKQIDIKVG